MTQRLKTIIRDASQPLQPQPTGVEPRLPKLPAIRAVLFDVYGTLLVSGSGDVGSADPEVRNDAFVSALAAVGVECRGDDAALLRTEIEAQHQVAKRSGNEHPEIDVAEVWRNVLSELHQDGQISARPDDVDIERLAVEFEVRANPIWPMPGFEECLAALRDSGRVLGIISNAQFFTPLAIAAVTGKTLDRHGFDPLLRYYSFEHRRAKPGRFLYERAAADLAERGIAPQQVLYVGNDMRNDVRPAAAVGFRTALFAGDRRSLRLRADEAQSTTNHEPDALVTSLTQIAELL